METKTMQPLGRRSSVADTGATPGLVLLYAPNFEELPPAFVFDRDTVVVGREPPRGGFRIPQDAVSRLHARIAREGEDWTVCDLESRNGTLVDGRVTKKVRLSPGSEVRFGDALFKFVSDGAEAFKPYRIDGAAVGAGALAAHAHLIGGFRVRSVVSELQAIGPTELTVLILGETGAGKELIARAVHDASGRSGGFHALNCAAVPATLLESELFGFKRGAFTGAHKDKLGLIAAAEGGTLLLDEIGDLPLDAQAKLLRVIETRVVTPLGSTASVRVNARLVCATHRSLEKMVEAGTFRADLFARINGYSVEMPPLRERKEDLYALMRHFLAKHGRPDAHVSFPFMAALCRYDWPFNVRELEATVKRSLALSNREELAVRHLPDAVRAVLETYGTRQNDLQPASGARIGAPDEAELRALLARHAGNLAGVARELGKDRAQVHRWVRAAGIDPNAYRK